MKHRSAAQRGVFLLISLLFLVILTACATGGANAEPRVETEDSVEGPATAEAIDPDTEPEGPETASSEPASAGSNPPYFRLTRGQLDIAVLGTLHLGLSEFFPLPQAILDDFENRGVLALEVNLRDYSPAKLEAISFQYMLAENDGGLTALVDEQTLAIVHEYFAAMGLPGSYADQFKPWAVEQIVSAVLILNKGYDPNLGTEQHLLSLVANSDERPILGLETAEFQLRMLDGVDLSYQAASLRRTIEEIEEVQSDVDRIVEAWRSGDLELIEALTYDENSLPGDREAVQIMLVDRNRLWAQKILEDWALRTDILDAGPAGEPDVFLAVGAAHLAGPDNIIELLEREGFEARRIR